MSIYKLPSGRYRSQVYDPTTGKNISVSKVLGPDYQSFRTKAEAKAARELARARLSRPRGGVTVGDFADRWLTDPLFARPKESTMIRNGERIKSFVAAFRSVPMRDVDDEIVSEWLATSALHSIPALRVMWNNAASAKAGRLVEHNPWAGLGLEASTGNRHKQPPTEKVVWKLITEARRLSGPYFAAWLQVACFTGMRPGELDILRWENVDLKRSRINVMEQFSATTRKVTSPKNGKRRDAILTPHARAALLALPRAGEHVFVTTRKSHFTTSARAYHWKAVRAGAGWEGSLYLATRHFAGAFMVNELELDSEDVAFALGHEDGGELVRKLYGHRDRARALDRVQAAYETTGQVRKLHAVADEETA
jgi:integrase